MGDIEKDFLLDLIKRYTALYLGEILGFCLMGNHFHILVKMLPEYKFTDEDIKNRYVGFYGDERAFADGQVPSLRAKLSSLSEFVREINRIRRFRYRTRYFTDFGVIGSKDFVSKTYIRFKHHFHSKNEKKPKPVKGLSGVYSLKRLSEVI